MIIDVERVEPGELRRQIWSFSAFDIIGRPQLRLNLWAVQERKSKRHKWADCASREVGEMYRYRNHNGVAHYAGFRRPAAEVPYPDDVVREARSALFRTLMEKLVVIGPRDPGDRE